MKKNHEKRHNKWTFRKCSTESRLLTSCSLKTFGKFLLVSCLLLSLLGVSVFADGAGEGSFDTLGMYIAGHNGYSIASGTESFVSIWSFDNSFPEYDGVTSRYKVESINYDYNNQPFKLTTFYFSPSTIGVDTVIPTHHYLDLTTDITFSFEPFVPSGRHLSDYVISTGYDYVDIELSYSYVYEVNDQLFTEDVNWTFERVKSVSLLNGLSGSWLYVYDLKVSIYNGSMEDYVIVNAPIVSRGSTDITQHIDGLFTSQNPPEVTNFFDAIFGWADDFFDVKLFGTISLGDILGVVIGFSVVIWLLKLVAGG